MKLIVAQLGARMHYAVPRILHEAGMLGHLYTDICASKGWPRLLRAIPAGLLPAQLGGLAGRIPDGVPPHSITAFTGFGLDYSRQLRRCEGAVEGIYLDAGKKFCRLVLGEPWGDATAVYTFNSAGLEVLHAAQERGMTAFMEQTIAPKSIEMDLLREERKKFGAWDLGEAENQHAKEIADRERAEWAVADMILCGSDFVRDGIAGCGGPVEKCVVIPYGVDVRRCAEHVKRDESDLLRVLTVGSIGLRKGIPYVMESAKRLTKKAVFRIVGRIDVPPNVEADLSVTLELTGPVPRATIFKHFQWADVFLLPSVCEGSATVTYEAMAHGLPVICTPNTGSVVRNGVDGFIVPVRDVGAIVHCLEILDGQPDVLESMSANALARAALYTVDAYRERLVEALRDSHPFIDQEKKPARA